ncbi:hypothetical protein DYU05_07330 [Mucilaginibacter terrenus]|uniref:Uncharacterized protein n=1 Tax=Mucilaginibacter terrenus TaxID=2482727 RepID=A0A3E2NWU8_9SPHI|nr:hypothetical protein DYU05_07330 [Mucilaginibacter terrenus]
MDASFSPRDKFLLKRECAGIHRVIARNEAILERHVADMHVDDCHAIARNDEPVCRLVSSRVIARNEAISSDM